MAIVQDLIEGTNNNPSVVEKLNYLTSIETTEVVRWIVSAVKNITDTFPFDELCLNNLPFVSLIPGQSLYTTSFLCNGQNFNISRIDSFLWLVNTTFEVNQNANAFGNGLPVITSGGNVCVELKWRSVKVVAANSQIPSTPVMYTTYGQSNSVQGLTGVLVAFQPNQPYQVQLRPQIKHPFSDGLHDEIMVPDSWLEVIACSAALIGAQANRMADNIQTLRTVLYGDPKTGDLGLIKPLVSSRAQMSNVNERMLNFQVSNR
jgi:hypothetical protein